MDNFIEQVERHLLGKTVNELKTIIIKLATMLPEEDCQDFIAKIESGRVIVSKNTANIVDTDKVMAHLKMMLEGIEDYSIEAYYYDHWNDDGYHIEDDGGFCDDFYKGYSSTVGLLEQGMYDVAAEAFGLLFDIVEHFNGHFESQEGFTIKMFISEGKLKVDLGAANTIWGYSQLMARPEDLHATLKGIFDRRKSYAARQTFSEVLEAGSEPVPNREAVIEAWISVLHSQPPEEASLYLKEAAVLLNNMGIMEDFVESSGVQTPAAYIDLCELYIERGDIPHAKIIEVARKGIENTIPAASKRGRLTTLLADIAQAGQDNDTYIYAVTQRFCTRMDIRNFLPIYALGNPQITDTAIQQLDSRHSKPKDFVDYYMIHFVNKDYDLVFDAIKTIKDSLGWSYSLKGAMFPYFMGLLAGFNSDALIIQEMLKHGLGDADAAIMYKLLRENIGQITGQQFENWHDWCAKEVGKRVDAIVSGQHRKSYFKAAYLLVGFCEVRLHVGDPLPYRMLQTYAAKYPRHSAFRGEIKEALNLAKLRDVKF